MILTYNYSHMITDEHQKKAVNHADLLIKSGNWCKSNPSFQTYSNLYEYKEFQIFTETFLYSCLKYLNINTIDNSKIFMWVYRDNWFNNRSKKQSDQWHNHVGKNVDKISGIYYLKNLRKEATEFKDFIIPNPEPYTWYIYPSDLLHKPPAVKSFRNRYTIAADFVFNLKCH